MWSSLSNEELRIRLHTLLTENICTFQIFSRKFRTLLVKIQNTPVYVWNACKMQIFRHWREREREMYIYMYKCIYTYTCGTPVKEWLSYILNWQITNDTCWRFDRYYGWCLLICHMVICWSKSGYTYV